MRLSPFRKEMDRLSEQMEYYRARASEYDEWFYRRGRYDYGEEWNARWRAEAAELERAVASLGACDTALELACGTGIWTVPLTRLAQEVTAVDSSSEVLALNRAKTAPASVRYVQSDIFAWEPDREYDLVFFSFWLSHVPPERLEAFLEKVRRAIRPGGRVFAIDSLPDDHSSARDHDRPDRRAVYQRRRLNDGREFRVVKIYYQPAGLEAAFARHGLRATVRTTGRFFWYAEGSPEDLASGSQ